MDVIIEIYSSYLLLIRLNKEKSATYPEILALACHQLGRRHHPVARAHADAVVGAGEPLAEGGPVLIASRGAADGRARLRGWAGDLFQSRALAASGLVDLAPLRARGAPGGAWKSVLRCALRAAFGGIFLLSTPLSIGSELHDGRRLGVGPHRP
jgi:hypothetical protein